MAQLVFRVPPILLLSPRLWVIYRALLCYEKTPMGATIFVSYSKHSDLSFVSVQRTFAVNSHSVDQTEQKFNKTFAVFAVHNGPLVAIHYPNCVCEQDLGYVQMHVQPL